MTFCSSIHELIVDGNWWCSHFSAGMDNATMDILVQVFVRMYVFIPLGCILGVGCLGPYGSSVSSLLRNCQTIFQSSGAIFLYYFLSLKTPLILSFSALILGGIRSDIKKHHILGFLLTV